MAGPSASGDGRLISPAGAFSASYARARVQFLEAAASAGMAISSHNHPLTGRDGEVLAMDVALDGDPAAERLLIVSSACHGVEGFCGSGIQVFAAQDTEWREHARAAGVAVLYIHALNPHGFSWVRRVTQENVDLNRNFHDFSQPLPANEAYAELHGLLVPEQWPPSSDNIAAVGAYLQTHGPARLQAAVSQGQHTFADGLFYGGVEATWSNRTLREVLRRHGRQALHLGWIDLHTGLGECGVGERIFASRDDPQALARARRWWDGDGQTPVTSIHDGSSSSSMLTGLMWNVVYEECPQAQYTGIAMEYGTAPISEVIDALRGDHWLLLHPEAPEAVGAAIKARLLAAFYVDSEEWKARVVVQARQALFQAVAGLSSS